MKKILIGLVVAVVLVLVLAVVGVTLFLDGAIKKGVETIGPKIAKVDIKLDGVNLSLLSGGGSIKGLVVGNPEGYQSPQAISVGHASLALQPKSLLSDKIVIKHIRVDAAEVTLEGGLRDNNLNKILENVTAATGGGAKPDASQETAAGKKLQVDEFLVTGAKVNVKLTALGGQPVTMTLPDIRFTNLGQGPNGITSAELTERFLREITQAAIKAASSDAFKDLSKGATEALKTGVDDSLQKATKGVTDLFKRKE